MTRQHRTRGFTLIEVMLVVAIIGILAGLAIGYAGTFNRDENLKSLARNIVNAMNLARAQSLHSSSHTAVTIGTSAIYAYVDVNGNFMYDGPDGRYLFRYPQSQTTVLDPTYTITSPAGGTSPGSLNATNPAGLMTALFSFEGYSINSQNQYTSALICVKDTQTSNTLAITTTIAGGARISSYSDAKILCP